MSDRTYLNSDYIKTPERQALDDWETTKDQAVEIAALRAEKELLIVDNERLEALNVSLEAQIDPSSESGTILGNRITAKDKEIAALRAENENLNLFYSSWAEHALDVHHCQCAGFGGGEDE